MRILVTGSRNWTDEQPIRTAIANLTRLHGDDLTVVHGGARGADSIADRVARNWGGRMRVEVHPADWERDGKSAGIKRNVAMVALGADFCFAFPLGESRGTWHCVRAAEKAGIPVIVYEGATS